MDWHLEDLDLIQTQQLIFSTQAGIVFPAVLGNMTNSRFFANPGKICRYCGHINKQINNRCAKCNESLEQESKGFFGKFIHSLNRQACSKTENDAASGPSSSSNVTMTTVHSATNDIEMMDFEYKEGQESKVSDLHNTGAKGNNTDLKSQTSENVEKYKKRKFVDGTDDDDTTEKKRKVDLTTIEERDKNICKIMDLGYSSEEASQALKLTNGNLTLAVDYLINKQPEAFKKDQEAQYPLLSSQSSSISTTRRPPSTFLPTGTPKMSVPSSVITSASPGVSSDSNVAFKFDLPQRTLNPKTTFSKSMTTPTYYPKISAQNSPGFPSSMLTPFKGESKATSVTGKSTHVTGKSTSVTGKSTSATGKTTPATSKSTYATGKSTPVRNKSTSVTGESAPVTGKSTSTTGKATPTTSKSTSATGKSTPVTDTRTDRSSSKSSTFLPPTEASAMALPSLITDDSVQDENKAYDSYNKMEEELTCPVCLELYVDPIILPCSHTLCKLCVKNIKFSEAGTREKGIKCPSCRKQHMKRIAKLPQNLALRNTLFHFQKVSHYHQQLILQKSMEKKPKLTLCNDHHDEHATMFCNQCKVLICNVCVCDGQGQHTGHKVIMKDAAADKIKKNAESEKKSLKPLVNAVQKRSQKIKQLCNDIEDVYTKACVQVEKQYEEMLKHLQEKKEGFLQTLTSEKTKAVSNLQKHLGQNQTTLKQVEISMTSYQNILEESNVEELLSKTNEMSSVIDNMMVIKHSLDKSKAEFLELVESRSIQNNLNEAVDKFRTALGHCVLPLANMLPVAPPIVRPSDTVEANSITPPSMEERDKNICKIMDLGYSSEEASQALKLTNGNLALAVDYLINKQPEAFKKDQEVHYRVK